MRRWDEGLMGFWCRLPPPIKRLRGPRRIWEEVRQTWWGCIHLGLIVGFVHSDSRNGIGHLGRMVTGPVCLDEELGYTAR